MAEPAGDAAARTQALEPGRSFIVQAPAGSGKTELLIQRFLKLLATVEHPEEVLAITFTRKAAAEMRHRVLDALAVAADAEPAAEPGRTTWGLAREVLAQDGRRGWNLPETPARLRIQTIDALCAALTRRMPWRSGFGGAPAVNEHADALHEEAARATLAHLEEAGPRGDAVARLLTHLDNNLATAQALLQAMLARRDQWLRHVSGHEPAALRAELEAVLARAVTAGLEAARDTTPEAAAAALPDLAAFAAGQLREERPEGPLAACVDLQGMPPAEPAALPQWLGLAELLLTQPGEWRRRVNKGNGFPPASAAANAGEREAFTDRKQAMEELLAALAGQEAFRAALAAVRILPPATFPEGQWEVLEALLALLPLAVEELRHCFGTAGEVDFTEVALAALTALGNGAGEGGGQDAAPALEYGIRHLLVDEFQDTSFSQFLLLERLTRGWREGDGRTLFLVGDPMQSIYRFREADVALYLRARQEGIGAVVLQPLTLTVNFRAQRGVADWLNAAFPRVMPEREELAAGAVPYTACEAARGEGPAPAVALHPFLGRDDEAEARQVVAHVQAAQAAHPDGTTAILVRARTHLQAILPALAAAGLPCQAVEIDPLGERPAVQDLLALTRALSHPADRVAWLAVLRAPWCGLPLAHLLAVAGRDGHATIWSLLADPELAGSLDGGGRERLERFREVMGAALRARYRRSPRAWVEGTWLALGGPAGLSEAGYRDALTFLGLLERLDTAGELPSHALLAEEAARLFAAPQPEATPALQAMTIHKAKGLQFDTVILPGLGRTTGRDKAPLLLWTELPADGGTGQELLLAPISATGESQDPIYRYLAELNKTRGANEDGRLLYVAVTRARQQVHLLGHAPVSDKGLGTPRKGSLLYRLWEVVAPEFEHAFAASEQAEVPEEAAHGEPEAAEAPDLLLHRLPSGWLPPDPPPPVGHDAGEGSPAEEGAGAEGAAPEFLWAGDTARHVGTVVHRTLQQIARGRGGPWSPAEVPGRRERFLAALRRLGVQAGELDGAADRVVEAVARTLADARGAWLLGKHSEASSELALTGLVDGETVHVQMDRTFVDGEGVRWIVDYKTGSHEGAGLDEFLEREQERYRAQLERYGRIMHAYDPGRPIRLALYFPLLQASREWDWAG